MKQENPSQPTWVRVLQIVGVVLLLWAAITLISGLMLADVGPEVEGRTFAFEDTGISGYGNLAWIGGAVGIILLVVQYFITKSSMGS